ncbi:MAG: tetratricopeptide repeat protein [Anaerolineae bacterium]|nr:MAG: tetratricopeptide repeat protein [Anaerolineae bacterium]
MTEQLQAVWRAVQTYLPSRAVYRLLSGLAPGEMWGELAEGTFLFADISGFTALADHLSALPDGVERLTDLINNYFTTMLQVVASSCEEMAGSQLTADAPAYDLLKFGGDAMLFLFSGPDHARLAVHAASRMQQKMDAVIQEARDLGTASLGMHIGINSGCFLDAHVGTPRLMKKVEVGRVLNLTARAAEFAASGQTVIGPGTHEAVRDWTAVQPVAGDFYLLGGTAIEGVPGGATLPVSPLALAPPSALNDLIASLDATVPYLLPGLLEKIIFDPYAPVVWADLKTVTVLFVNLLGLDEMVEALGGEGVEEVTSVLDRYLGAVMEIVTRYDGTVNKMDLALEGDKLLILFGAPHAHEDDPHRAVRAALEMQEALRPFTELPTPAGTFSLRLRIGIHSGNVFAGNVGSPMRKEYTVIGDTVNLAARLMAAAKPGQILVSQGTQRRLGDGFACHPLPPLRVKGKSKPVDACQVTGFRGEGLALRRAARHGQLIGRQQEVALLQAVVGRVLGGEGQAVSVVGDAGVGKSRLVDELAAHAERVGMRVLRGGCVSYGTAMAYLPWIELLRGFWGWAAEDTATVRREKLQVALAAADPTLTDWAPVVASVLGLSMPETPLTRTLDAKLRKERFFDIASQVLESQAQESPLLLIFEDLHWADPISLELLDYVARNLGDSPLLLVGLRRPAGSQPQWDDLPHHQVVRLGELSTGESRELALSLLRSPSLPPTLEGIILDRAQGNPFYVEEVVHVLMDRGYLTQDDGGYRLTGDLSDVEIPSTISGVVMSRIDSLDEGPRTVLRVASVIGRVFLCRVLQAIYPYPIGKSALQQRLGVLQRLDLTPLEEAEPDLKHIFKHILTQEVAYESLLHARRRDLHGQVALYYEETHRQEGLEEYYDLLAYHFGRSTYRDKALEYAICAGDRARAAYANDAAIRYYVAALELLAEQGQAHTLRWADLQFELAEVYVHVGRYEEAIAGYRQAMEATGPSWPVEQRARTLRKIGMAHESQGQYNEALEWLGRARQVARSDLAVAVSRTTARILADTGAVHIRKADFATGIGLIRQALALLSRLPRNSERLRDEGWAHNRLGIAHAQQGNLHQAGTFFEQSLMFWTQAGDLVGVATQHNNLGYLAYLQGDVQAAIESYERSLRVCRQIGYRYVMAMASNNLGMAYQVSGNYQPAVACYQQSLEIRQEMGDLAGIASTYDNLGMTYHQRGDYEKAIEYHHQSLAIKRQQEDTFNIANSLINIAAVCRDQGHHEEAIGLAEEALAIFEQVGGRQYLAETYTVLAEAYLRSRQYGQARRYARLALETAEETGSQRDRGIAARALGEVEMALAVSGTPDSAPWRDAQDRLRQSAELLDSVGDRFELGKSLRSQGLCLKLAGLEAEGVSHLARAVQIFQDLGAQGELQRAIAWESGKLTDDLSAN